MPLHFSLRLYNREMGLRKREKAQARNFVVILQACKLVYQ